MGEFAITTRVAVNADDLWREVCSLEAINYEMRPILRMTMPKGLRGSSIDELEVPAYPGKSWLLLAGVLPVDYDDLGIVELGERRFLERSKMLSMSLWQHERFVEPAGETACAITDHLAFTLRGPLGGVGFADRIAERSVGAIFRHRHRKLVLRHGSG